MDTGRLGLYAGQPTLDHARGGRRGGCRGDSLGRVAAVVGDVDGRTAQPRS